MFDQVANIIARKSIASHALLIKTCKSDKEKLKQLRSKNGWTVLQFAIYKEDAECVQILASNMPELVNVVGNSVLPIQSAFNLHMRDEHTLQQRQIIHILIDFGAVGVFRALMSRQYMCAPNYERNFIGWTIRTMLRVSNSKSQVTAVNVVNDAFKLDIEEIIRQKKRDVYKNEIKLIVKLGNKINKGLLFNEIVQEIDNPTIEVIEEMPELEENTAVITPEVQEEINEAPEESTKVSNEEVLEVTDNATSEDQNEEVIDAESALAEDAKSNSLDAVIENEPEKVEKLLENVKEVGSALSNLVSSATKSEEILNENVNSEETQKEVSSTQLEETVDKSTLEQSIDEINSTIKVAEESEVKLEESVEEGEEFVATGQSQEVTDIQKSETQLVSGEQREVAEAEEAERVEVNDASDNSINAENKISDSESDGSTVKVESEDVPVEEPVEISEDSLDATQKDNVDEVAEDQPTSEPVIEILPELGSPPSSTGDEVEVAEYAAIAEKNQAEEVNVIEQTDVTVETALEVTVEESYEVNVETTTEEATETAVVEEVVDVAETSAEEIPATSDSFVVVDDSVQSVEDSAELIEKESDEIEQTPGDDKPKVSEDINDEFNNEIPSNAIITTPNVDVYQLEYTADEQTNEESAHKMVLLKQAEDVIFSEGTISVTDGQDTGVCNSSDECLSDASSTNHEDILSDGSTTLSPLSDIESLSEYLDAEEKLELEMSLRKEFDDYGKADLSIEAISQIRCDKGTQTDDDFEIQKAACRAAIESVLKFDSLEHCGRASLSKAQYVRFWVLMASLQRIDESKLNQSMTNLYQSALPLFKHIPKLSK